MSREDQGEIDRYWMPEPCGPCPYSRSKTLPLAEERAQIIAWAASGVPVDEIASRVDRHKKTIKRMFSHLGRG